MWFFPTLIHLVQCAISLVLINHACNLVTSFSFAAISGITAYGYLHNYHTMSVPFEMDYGSLTANENDLLIFLGFFFIANIAIRIMVNRYILRIYRNEEDYIAIFEGHFPFTRRQFSFKKGNVEPVPEGGILPWQDARYKINEKHVLLLDSYFRTPSELMNMLKNDRHSFDFDPSSHDPVDDLQQSSEDQRRQQSHNLPSPAKQQQPQPLSTFAAAAKSSPSPTASSSHQMNWNRSDAAKALLVEAKAIELLKSPNVLVLRFPDPELNKEIVQGYSICIENVIFHRPSTPRYCLVHLKPDADVDRVIQQLSKISFGAGNISVERKTKNVESKPTLKPEEIDPLTLFIGNLPNAVTVYTVKQMFPTARRIDIGHAQRMKHTRYAFIRFHNVNDAIGAFKANFNKVIDGKNIIVRFRRHNAPIAMPEDTNTPKTPKRQKGLGQLFVSVEQKPTRNIRTDQQHHQLEIHHSDTLNTIRTDILDDDIVKEEIGLRPRVKLEPPDLPEHDFEEEESDDIEDFLEDDEAEDLNLDEINADDNYCEDEDTDVDAIDKNYWTLEQLRSKASNDASASVSESLKSDIFMEPESATKTSCSTTFTTKPKDHKPYIVSKRRDDQLQDLFSCLEPDDDLSL